MYKMGTIVTASCKFSSVAQTCPSFCDPTDYNMPGFSTNSMSLLKLMSIKSVSHPTIPSSVIAFSSHLQSFPASGSFAMMTLHNRWPVLHIRWPKSWSFTFSINSSNENSELISFRIDWLDLLAV